MSVIFFWTGNNYTKDIANGKAYFLEQNSELINKLKPTEHVWAFTRIDNTYVLAADLIVSSTQPGQEYGRYRAVGNKNRSRYFNVYKAPNTEPLIRSLSFSPKAKILGHSFQGERAVKLITLADENKLINFATGLPVI